MSMSLTSLLYSCQNLHSGLLSLGQLAAVHKSLCQSSGNAKTKTDCKTIHNPVSLDPIIDLVCNEDDQTQCMKIIEGSSDAERLLMIQFLMFSLTFADSVRCVLVPYLLLENSDLSEELAVTLLDLLDGTVDEKSELLEIIDSVNKPNLMTGRILVKLLQGANSSQELIQAFHEKLRQTIREAAASPLQLNSVVSALSKDLLPVLTQPTADDGTALLWKESHRPHTLELWNQLFSFDYSSSEDENRTNLLAITTVLCPLLPHLVACELPIIDNQDTRKTPLEHPQLWHLVYTCLSQGKSLLERGAATSAILRKRALYLLNILASTSDEWKKYCMCFETLEMETEQHLVDQIWDTVDELLAIVEAGPSSSQTFGVLTWEWMSLLFARALSTEQTVIRKLGLYRLLKVQDAREEKGGKEKRKGKKKTHHVPTRVSSMTQSILLKMPPDFVLDVLLPSWNSLRASVGYNMHLESISRKVEKEDMIPLMMEWLHSYLEQLQPKDAQVFWTGIWNWSLIQRLHIKNIVIIFKALAEKLASSAIRIPVDNQGLESLKETIQLLFQDGACVVAYQKEMLHCLATILAHCTTAVENGKKWAPMTILKLLSLFSADYFSFDSQDWKINDETLLVALGTWIAGLEQDPTTIGAAVAAAFVGGDLTNSKDPWDPALGAPDNDRELGWAVSVLCTLAAWKSNKTTTGQLLWPAINKGLAGAVSAIVTEGGDKASHVTRALLLLENGCRLRELSGLGNGDLVVDRNTEQLMPPPPNIEKMLSSSSDFIVYHIRTLLTSHILLGSEKREQQIKPKQVLVTYSRLIGQIRILQQSYPSSNVVSNAVEDLFKSTFEALSNGAENDVQCAMLIALIYASVSSGVDPGSDKHIPLCRLLLTVKLKEDEKTDSLPYKHAVLATVEYARWAGISCVLPMLMHTLGEDNTKRQEAEKMLQDVLATALAAIESTPSYGCLPLFNCVLLVAQQWAVTRNSSDEEGEEFYVENLKKVINGLLALMSKSGKSQEKMDMLNEICALIFQPKLLHEEFNRLEGDSKCATPIRGAFRRLVEMAGHKRPHILKAVLCRITVAWLGENGNSENLGLNAIPYRDDIVKLVLHKELRVEESAKNQSKILDSTGTMEIPAQTNELSVTRAFILVFFSKLPDPSNGLDEKVLKELLHHIILKLLVETAPSKSISKSLVMKGTPAYCLKMRGWQALCNLSRFVTNEIASQVSEQVFAMMPEHIHGQVRYFIEIFTIQCARYHPEAFGSVFLREVSRRDLNLQHVSSLMIISGNWIAGHYKNEYFNFESGNTERLKRLLAALIPWLSSTQGFSRAIAQLLVHKLTPLCIDITNLDDIPPTEVDWFPRVIYRFLDENREMKRLRKKQSSFFERYSVEEMCTAEGVLSAPVDEGDEADPVHMVDAMKEILKNVYSETHGDDIPAWKAEQLLRSDKETSEDSSNHTNFQRKIIPLDSLNLAMEDLRQKRLRNAAGKKKQQLIVCASLVDKVPNLGGLARTAEIFAADRLVIPDLAVCKMDNFKSLSVGAGDWIEMEEVRQENLLSWLLALKAKGYFVFGLEQTSSSVSLSEMVFPDRPTVLLLGKEKEGIPVEYLQAVDQCVEIPQLGVIRSLNVHVSGAIAIWEHTKQRGL